MAFGVLTVIAVFLILSDLSVRRQSGANHQPEIAGASTQNIEDDPGEGEISPTPTIPDLYAYLPWVPSNTPTPTLISSSQSPTSTPEPSSTPTPQNDPTSTPMPTSLPTATPTITLTPTPTISDQLQGNPYGVMLSSNSLTQAERLNIAQTLGVAYYRPSDIDVSANVAISCQDCQAFLSNGVKLILTVRNGGGGGVPSDPPDDLNLYKSQIAAVLSQYKPALLVVENEENSNALFYSGTPAEYHVELTAACAQSHSQGYKCTNGGLVSSFVALLVGNSYYEQGDSNKANDYLKRTLDSQTYAIWLKNPNDPQIQDQISKGKALISGYKEDGADYINFHWYINDTEALDEAITYLHTTSGLSVVSNEVGQQGSINSSQVTNISRQMYYSKLPLAVWFSIDMPGADGAKALNYTDGTLRSNGVAYKNVISEYKNGTIPTPTP